MEYCTGRTEFEIQENSAVTLGKFDGVHAGHRKLMKRILDYKKQGCKAVVFTFDTPPYSVLGREKAQMLTTNEERRIILERLGIDYLIECPFVPEIISMEPEEFIKRILVDRLNVKYIVIGTDFRFGHNRRGDAEMLATYADEYGYQLEVVEKEVYENDIISSTRIRSVLENGDMEAASMLLNGPYHVMGNVVHGKELGRQIGIPTVNLIPDDNKLLPPNGVYFSKTLTEKGTYYGVTNIGVNPTVEHGTIRKVETNLFDYKGDLYDTWIDVELYHWERKERKFLSVDDLQTQMFHDILLAQKYFRR